MSDAHREAEERLRDEIDGLPVDDILALCYALRQRQDLTRLRLYLDVLRKKGGERAQFASCLICYDLARQGDQSAQREFVYLADTIQKLSQKQELVDTLSERDPYLMYVWELCKEQLAEMDPRFLGGAVAVAPPQAEGVTELNLLSDADFASDFAVDVDDSGMWLRFDQAVETFLGGEVGVPVYDPTAGFRLRSNSDVERIEAFLMELDSVREFVPPARGFRALALLFYGTHMRSKSLFGTVNERKQQLLRAGVAEFLDSAGELTEVAGVLGPMHAETTVWEKVGDVLEDYVRWAAQGEGFVQAGPRAYDAVGRLIERDAARPWKKGYG